MPLRTSFLTLGFISALTQVILIKALLVNTGGSELAVAAALASWLLCSGISSILLGPYFDKIAKPASALSTTIAALPLAMITGLISLKVMPYLSETTTAALPSPSDIVLWSFWTTLPLSFLLGSSFNLCVRTQKKAFGESLRAVYVYEASGAAAGGFLVSWLLFELIGSAGLAWISFAACIFTASWLAIKSDTHVKLTCILLAITSATALAIMSGSWLLPVNLENAKVISFTENRFGVLTETEREGEITLFSGSRPMLNSAAPETDEETALAPFTLKPDAKTVLWLGPNFCKAFKILRRYGIQTMTAVNPDKDAVALELKQCRVSPSDLKSRLKIVTRDYRRYVNESGDRFDLVVVNTDEPRNNAANRLFTKDFFNTVKWKLTKSGVFVFFSGSPGNYIGEFESDYIVSTLKSLRGSFDHATVLPFSRYIFAASNDEKLRENAGKVDFTLQLLRPLPKYFTNDYVVDALSDSRMEMLSKALKRSLEKQLPENSDLHPTAPYYRNAIANSKFDTSGIKTAAWMQENGKALLLGIIAFLLALGFAITRIEKRGIASGLLLIGITGAGGIVQELVLMNALQSWHGELYHSVGLLLAGYMTGLGVGAHLAQNVLSTRLGNKSLLLISLPLLATIHCMTFAMLRFGIGKGSLATALIAFGMTLFAIALLSGICFQAAAGYTNDQSAKSRILKGKPATLAGLVHGFDHVFAAFAALAAGILILPLLGTLWTTALVATSCVIGVFYLLGR